MPSLVFLLIFVVAAQTASADAFPDAPHVYVEGSAEIRVEPDTLELAIVIAKPPIRSSPPRRRTSTSELES